MSKIDRIIEYFRALKEEGPTMSTGSVVGGPAGFSSDAAAERSVAGFSGVLHFMRRAKKKAKRKKRNKN